MLCEKVMSKLLNEIIIFICVLTAFFPVGSFAGMYDHLRPKRNEVVIHFSGVEVPLNRILLIRKDTEYCAVKFIRCWTEIDEKRLKKYAKYITQGGDMAKDFRDAATKKYAIYESYYQKDGMGDFSGKNMQMRQGNASWLPLRGPFRPFIYQPGNAHIKCGPFNLGWQYRTGVSVIPAGKGMGGFGYELAPTPWTDISQVNIFDSRVKWYGYDEKRERTFIPIEKLWDEKK